MDTRTEQIISEIASDLDDLRRTTAADLIVLRTALTAAIPHLTNSARIAMDRALRAVMDGANPDDQTLDWTRLQLAPLEMGALLPIHRPGWTGLPDPPT